MTELTRRDRFDEVAARKRREGEAEGMKRRLGKRRERGKGTVAREGERVRPRAEIEERKKIEKSRSSPSFPPPVPVASRRRARGV